jgi:hypothetical protein
MCPGGRRGTSTPAVVEAPGFRRPLIAAGRAAVRARGGWCRRGELGPEEGVLDAAGILPPGGGRPVDDRLGGGEFVDDPTEVDRCCGGAGQRSESTRGQPAQRGDRSTAEAAVDSLAGGELGGEDFAPPQSGGDRVATSLAATWLPRPAIDRCRRPSGAGLDGWVGRSALTGWTAGAHVPAIQLSSLPLDEWHYMRHNEAGRVRLRTARIGTPRWRTAARRPAGPIRRRRPQGRRGRSTTEIACLLHPLRRIVPRGGPLPS